MPTNGREEPRTGTSGVSRVAYSSNQYTVKLAAIRRDTQAPAPAPTRVPAAAPAPVYVPRTDTVPIHTRITPPSSRTPVAPAAESRSSRRFRGVAHAGTFVRWATVTVGTLVLSTLAINAIDSIDNPQYLMLGAVFNAYESVDGGGPCPSGMAYVDTSDGGFCIDAYEASAGSECLYATPGNMNETDANLAMPTCKPESREGVSPWVFVSRHQAELACAHAGKRLPSATEWYQASLGTPETDGVPTGNDCNTEGNSSSKTGAHAQCVSPAGAYDMVGNVWEWQKETATDGVLEGRTLPADGYIVSIDDRGIPIATDPALPSTQFFNDYFAINPVGVQGVLRGGYWRSGTDAGVYGMNVTVPPSFQGNAVGFRCAKSAGK